MLYQDVSMIILHINLHEILFFRYDKTNSQCGHMECAYFLSYTYKHTPEKTEYEFDMELSGHASGWIAVGFSSDQQMVTA